MRGLREHDLHVIPEMLEGDYACRLREESAPDYIFPWKPRPIVRRR
jgi:hypothetical protein